MAKNSEIPTPEPEILEIPLDQINANPKDNMRRHYSFPALQELMNSIIRTGGLLTPVIVERMNEQYTMRGGFRRYFAHIQLQQMHPGYFGTIRSKVYTNLTPEQRQAIMVAENVCKEKIPNVELARGIWELYKVRAAITVGIPKAQLDRADDYWSLDSRITDEYPMARFALEIDKSKDTVRRAFTHQRIHKYIERDVTKGLLSYTAGLEFARIRSKKQQWKTAKKIREKHNGMYPATPQLRRLIRNELSPEQEEPKDLEELTTEFMAETIKEDTEREKRKYAREKLAGIKKSIREATRFISTFTELLGIDSNILRSTVQILSRGNISAEKAVETYAAQTKEVLEQFRQTEGYKGEQELERLLGRDLEEQFKAYAARRERRETKAVCQTELARIPVSKIVEDERNARRTFNTETLKEMVESFKLVGQLEPVLARPVQAGRKQMYKLVDGHRRFRAIKIAELDEVEAIVEEMSEEDAALYQIEADVHQKVSAHEIAETIAALYEIIKEKRKGKYNIAQFCREHRGLKAHAVKKALTYYTLDDNTKTLAAAGLISFGAALELRNIKNLEKRQEYALLCVLERLNVYGIRKMYEKEEKAKRDTSAMFADFDSEREQKAGIRRQLIKTLDSRVDASVFFDKRGEFTLERLSDRKEIASALYQYGRAYERLIRALDDGKAANL